MLSQRATKISPSATIQVTSKAKALKKEGKDVVILAAGEPDFPSPGRVKSAGIKAIEHNFTTYTATSGIPELKQAICKKFMRDNKLSYKPGEVMVSAGAKQALYIAFQCLLNPGDKVILTVPCWNSYIEQIHLAGGESIQILSHPDMSPHIENIASSITEDTKVLLLNSPCNPSGYVFTKEEVKALGEIALKNKNLFIITDDVYEYFIYEGEHINIATLFPELKDRTVIVNSVSKSYSMPGWRLGYAAGPEKLISSMTSLQDHMSSNPCSISQMAALEAIDGEQDDVKSMLKEFTGRRNYIVENINKLPLIKCAPPKGAFYSFIDISETKMDSMTFAGRLLEEELVAIIPGIAFGMDNFVRLSFASSFEDIKKGIERIGNFLQRL